MPRPEVKEITFSIDGRDVVAPEGLMLVDAAKLGDVEIPVFCYEPKLGAPVGACRQCLVEIEGIPKLQTGCSTPVKEGMVVHTATDRVQEAQASVLEFLLINHPLDCPVCDKGGECPLQDMSFGFGKGNSRFVEPKRHFKKPLELSPLIAIDRERCILCYRCVRFSQELSEDYQLILHERGASTFVGTFDGHPYVAPFSGNIIELCPVGALTSRPYRFRARPWDIENSGSVCTLCPGQCNVAFTVRDDRVLRVLERGNDEVDDGWLCDKGRFAYQAIHVDDRITAPMIRDGGVLRETTWERALEEAALALGKTGAGGRIGALAGGGTTNEEGYLLQHLIRDVHRSPHLDSRTGSGVSRGELIALGDPALQATVADLEFAHTVLVLGTEPVDDMAPLDLRLRKGVRRNRVQLAIASPRPSTLDPNASLSVRYAPGGEGAFVTALTAALYGGDVATPATAAGADEGAVKDLADLLRTSGGEEATGDVVVVYPERILTADGLVAPLLKLAGGLSMGGRAGAGLLAIPDSTNGRGLREAGVLPDAGPGYAALPARGRDATGIAEAVLDGSLTVLHLLHTDPFRDQPSTELWDRAMEKATHVVAHAGFLTAGLAEHATVIFPAESQAEKEGTVVHPDGRLQRLRPAIGRQGQVRATWQVLTELARRAGSDKAAWTVYSVTKELLETVPFYAGMTVDTIGPKGTRWWADDARAGAFPGAAGELPAGSGSSRADAAAPGYATVATPNGALRLGTYRSIWAYPEVEVSPALKFLAARQQVELAPADATALGLDHGDRVVVSDAAGSVEGVVHLRHATPSGSAFLQRGIAADAAGSLVGPLVEIAKWEPPVLVVAVAEEDQELLDLVADSDTTGLADGSLAASDEATSEDAS